MANRAQATLFDTTPPPRPTLIGGRSVRGEREVYLYGTLIVVWAYPPIYYTLRYPTRLEALRAFDRLTTLPTDVKWGRNTAAYR